MDLQPVSSPAKGSVIGVGKETFWLPCHGALYIFVLFDPIKERKADPQGSEAWVAAVTWRRPASEIRKPGAGLDCPLVFLIKQTVSAVALGTVNFCVID